MAIDDLKNRYYALKNKNGCFCSKCGKKILNDSYLIAKHQVECGVKFENEREAVDENEAYGYAFKIKDNKLVFYVYQLKMELSSGFSDKYNGGKWKNVFRAVFKFGSKEVREDGLYNVDVWFKMLLEKTGSACLNKYDPEKVIREYFKSIPLIYSYGDFLDIYRQRGYYYNDINIEKIKEIPEAKQPTKTELSRHSKYITVSEHKVNNQYVLELNVYIKAKKKARIFISKDFYYGEDDYDYADLFAVKSYKVREYRTVRMVKDEPVYKINDISKFNAKYPELMIDEYLKSGGNNLFQAVMSQNYNKMIENLGKGGLGYIADHIDQIQVKNIYGNNVKQIFGYKANMIKPFNNEASFLMLQEPNILETMERVAKIQPAILNLDLNYEALELIYYNFNSKVRKSSNKIKGVSEFNKDEILKILRVFSQYNEPYDLYYHYRDYMDMCYDLNAFPYGKIPKNIFMAHEYVSEIYACAKDRILSEKFTTSVNREEYIMLDSTAKKDKDGKVHFGKDEEEYRIIVPKTQHDLTKESECLNHCVRTYIGRVAEQKTFILFLRRKNELHKPYATIEVTPDMILIQLKAVNNSKACKSAQDFVKKWAKDKNIIINSYDMR